MTDIDLKWLLPFVLPFVIIGTIRAFVWFAGFGWGQTEGYAIISFLAFIVGFVGGAVLVGQMVIEEKRLTLRCSK